MSKRKLLLADDSVTIQKVVNLTFADEGIEVITVGDGDSAIQSISANTPDVVLADVHMPGLSGYQICEIIRENPETKNLPVVLLVGSFEPFDENEAARVGANAFLTKPFQSIRQLVSQVTDLMQQPAETPSDQVAEFVPADETPERTPGVADTTDIESLYNRSVGEPEGDEAESGPPRYVDAGMDDEMIETSSGDDDNAADEGDEHRAVEIGEPYTEPAAAGSPFDSMVGDSHAAAASATAMSEQDAYFDEFTPAGDIPVADEAPAADERATEREFQLDEAELLELPPIDTGRTLEFTTTQSMMAEGGTKEIVSLSPELMEIIVQKVVDKLSNKT